MAISVKVVNVVAPVGGSVIETISVMPGRLVQVELLDASLDSTADIYLDLSSGTAGTGNLYKNEAYDGTATLAIPTKLGPSSKTEFCPIVTGGIIVDFEGTAADEMKIVLYIEY